MLLKQRLHHIFFSSLYYPVGVIVRAVQTFTVTVEPNLRKGVLHSYLDFVDEIMDVDADNVAKWEGSGIYIYIYIYISYLKQLLGGFLETSILS